MMMLSRFSKYVLFTVLAVQLGCSTHTKLPPAAPAPSPAETPAAQPNESPSQEPASANTQETKPPEAPRPRWPESVIARPETEIASAAVKYDTVLMSRALDSPKKQGWQYRLDRQGRIVGFEFSNHGGNAILPERYDLDKNRL